VAWDDAERSEGGGTLPRADSPIAAVDAASLVVVMADDYAAARNQLDQIGPSIAGRDVINLTSGTSGDALEAARVVSALGGRYLDGALMAHPEHVGNTDTVLVYSGSRQVFDRHKGALGALGGATYLGDDAGTAALYDLAMLNLAWATLLGYLQTVALLTSAGVAATTVTPQLTRWLGTTVADVIIGYAREVDEGRYPGDEEWLELDAPLMDHLIEVTSKRGLDGRLPQLIKDLTAQGIDAGHGADSFGSLIDVIRSGSS
jgi:3-hydroxyisobutyrate dehydrogenase-like beta-hydroxyacid dehydrogenase